MSRLSLLAAALAVAGAATVWLGAVGQILVVSLAVVAAVAVAMATPAAPRPVPVRVRPKR